jgi:hypothetical protein
MCLCSKLFLYSKLKKRLARQNNFIVTIPSKRGFGLCLVVIFVIKLIKQCASLEITEILCYKYIWIFQYRRFRIIYNCSNLKLSYYVSNIFDFTKLLWQFSKRFSIKYAGVCMFLYKSNLKRLIVVYFT